MARFSGTPINQGGGRFGGTPVEQQFKTLDEIRREVQEESKQRMADIPYTARFAGIGPEMTFRTGPEGEAPGMAQAGRGMMDVYQGARQLTQNIASAMGETTAADEYNQKLKAELDLYNQNNPDFQLARIVGSVATPLAIIPGGIGATTAARVGTGAVLGAASATLDPVASPDDYWTVKGQQAALGATVGGVIPAGEKLFRVVAGWLDEMQKPLTKRGVRRDVVKFLKDNITENRDKIISALDDAAARGDRRTVSQIIADTVQGTDQDFGGKLVRLEDQMQRHSDSLKSLYARQDRARTAVLDTLAGTEDDLTEAIATRNANALANYQGNAFKIEVEPDESLMQLLRNKFGKQAIKDAQDLVTAKRAIADVPGEYAPTKTEFLHYVKESLDKQLKPTAEKAIGREEKRVITGMSEKLVDWLRTKNPAYGNALDKFREDSIPINKMQIANALRDKFRDGLDVQKPVGFANALKNPQRLMKQATGFEHKNLSEFFSPEEIASLKGVAKELKVEKQMMKMRAKSASLAQELTGEIRFELPHILSRPVVITNHVLKRLGVDRTPEYRKQLTEMLMDPEKFIRAYGGPASEKATQNAMDIVRRLEIIAASQYAGTETGEVETSP